MRSGFNLADSTWSTPVSFPQKKSVNHLVSIRLPDRKESTLQSADWISTALSQSDGSKWT